MQEKNGGLVQKLMDKYNIIVDTFNDNFKFGLIMMTAATVVLLTVPAVMAVSGLVNDARYENDLNSTVVYNDEEYHMSDMSERNYEINFDEVSDNNIDSLSSRESGIRR